MQNRKVEAKESSQPRKSRLDVLLSRTVAILAFLIVNKESTRGLQELELPQRNDRYYFRYTKDVNQMYEN